MPEFYVELTTFKKNTKYSHHITFLNGDRTFVMEYDVVSVEEQDNHFHLLFINGNKMTISRDQLSMNTAHRFDLLFCIKPASPQNLLLVYTTDGKVLFGSWIINHRRDENGRHHFKLENHGILVLTDSDFYQPRPNKRCCTIV